MNIFITGVSGFIGSHLAETLLTQGHTVLGIDNFNGFYSPQLKRQNLEEIKKIAEQKKQFFQCYSRNIGDADALNTLLSEHKIELVIHLAAMAGVRPSIQNPLLYEKVNGLGTLTLLEAMKKNEVKNLVFGSSSSVYGLNKKVPFSESDPVNQPYSPYAITKRSGELMCYGYHQLYHFNVACLRFFTVYGPRQRPDLAIRKFTELIYQDKPIPILGDGSFKRDFTYVDDIIDGVVKSINWIMESKQIPRYDIFNLGESQTTSILELVELLQQATDKKIKKEFLPQEPGDIPITYADITKAKSVLGYDPKTKIKEGIGKFIEWYKKNYAC